MEAEAADDSVEETMIEIIMTEAVPEKEETIKNTVTLANVVKKATIHHVTLDPEKEERIIALQEDREAIHIALMK